MSNNSNWWMKPSNRALPNTLPFTLAIAFKEYQINEQYTSQSPKVLLQHDEFQFYFQCCIFVPGMRKTWGRRYYWMIHPKQMRTDNKELCNLWNQTVRNQNDLISNSNYPECGTLLQIAAFFSRYFMSFSWLQFFFISEPMRSSTLWHNSLNVLSLCWHGFYFHSLEAQKL
jgi:hypothetical protein